MKKVLFMLFAMLISINLWSADKTQAVIIFDASGSMWGQIDGKAKITIAKEALNSVVKEWSPDVELGLTVYGHRKKGDCNDIESLVPIGSVDKNKITSLVKNIQPKGKTPIARSLKKVAEELKFTEEKATIILISDGKESCDTNPCDVAKELEKKGIDFVTHVVGFNVDKKTDEELECIASVTGGEYFSAKNATALNEAMKSIVKKVEKVGPKPKPKIIKDNLEISASETADGKWIKAYIASIKNSEGEQVKGGYHTGKKEPQIFQLPLGKYTLDMIYNQFKKRDIPFEIKENEVTKLHVVFGQTNKVEISASETADGKWISAYIASIKNSEGEQVKGGYHTSKKEPQTFQLPLGKYTLDMSYNQFKKKNIPFEIKPDEVTKVHVVMGQTGKVEISASEKEGGKWIQAYIASIKNADGKQLKGGYRTSKKEPKVFQLPLGKYTLDISYNNFKKKAIPFEIKAGEVTKLHVILEQFIINVKCSDKNSKVSYEIYASSGRMIDEQQLSCSKPLQLTLDKGDYTVEAKVKNGSKEEKFTVGRKVKSLTIDLTNINHKQ